MSLKIVYLDDEPDLLEMFVDTFSSPDLEIATFTETAPALENIKANPPDIVFLDYRLRNTTGDKVAMEIAAHIPKALITGELGINPKCPIDVIFYKPYKTEDVEKFIDSVRQKQARG